MARLPREDVKNIPIASTIAEFKFIELREKLQPVVGRDGDGSQGNVDWPYTEGFQGEGRSGQDQLNVHIGEVPRPVKVSVN